MAPKTINNIRGWLTDINQVDSGHSDDASDLFDFHINYNQVADHMEHQVDGLYNGNISETFWKSASDNTTRKYGYTYDALGNVTDVLLSNYQRKK